MHPGRCSFNDDFNPSTAVHSGSLQSFLALGLLQIWAASGDFGAVDGRRWSSPTRMVCTVAKDVVVIFVFFRAFVKVGRDSCTYILFSHICVWACLVLYCMTKVLVHFSL